MARKDYIIEIKFNDVMCNINSEPWPGESIKNLGL